ncbi:LuxR C-terminal-related transcriptional regulator [Modestobacter excelsi]|uniref:LuxR C-terminal-related transcriptional regulator n=1 Tax=Modestobacter excelsi TaxID=2213161 RepID=UPI001C20E2DA|nr:LuxR C-terminal-related transcriptional regulator [Modestobacter excelsi]
MTPSDGVPGRGRDAGQHHPQLSAVPSPFVDRDHKLQALLATLDGDRPGAVVVSGPQGAGRTRLAQEALAALHQRGHRSAWATATRTAAGIPLAALAHLVPVVGAGSDPAAVWQAMASSLDNDRSGRPVVLVIDDAHLLDDLSAAMVHKLVLTGAASVVLTVLSGARGPDLVDALWRDRLATRVELRPWTRPQVEEGLRARLGGTPESRLVQTLWRVSGGSAVMLHELVQAGHETARLRSVEGIWRWEGEPALTQRLREVVQAEMGDLTDSERAAMELLAIAGALELGDLLSLTSPAVVTALERRGRVVVERVSRRPVARLAQPLEAEVLCAQMPQAASGQYLEQLAGTGSVRRWAREDPLRIGPLLLQLDGPPRDVTVLTRAAVQANAASDHELAERLARAALDERAGPTAAAALVEALRWQSRHEEAEQVAARAAPSTTTTRERDDLAVTRMLNLFALGRVREAFALAGVVSGSTGVPGQVVEAVVRVLRLANGEPPKPTFLTDDVPDRKRTRPVAALWDDVACAAELAALGHSDESLECAARAWRALGAGVDGVETACARTVLMQVECWALEMGGRLPAVESRAIALHEASLGRSRSAADAVAALSRGSAALLAGRAAEGVRWLAEAAARLVETDPVGCLPLCLAKLAHAHALLGDAASAASTLAAARAEPAIRIFEPELLLAEAWAAAAAGRDGQSGEAALRAASAADEMGLLSVEAVALHTAARLGRAGEVAGRLAFLATELGGPLFTSFAALADAVARSRGEALDEVAERFRQLGALSCAADAAALAAQAHRSVGHRRRAAASGSRANVLARSAGGLHTPALDRLAPYALTQREREIAVLAAAGTRNQSIAEQLVLSVRTVETHLAHVYDKLGINSRAALRAALGAESCTY